MTAAETNALISRSRAYREVAAYLRGLAPQEATATGREGCELGAAYCLHRARAIEEAETTEDEGTMT